MPTIERTAYDSEGFAWMQYSDDNDGNTATVRARVYIREYRHGLEQWGTFRVNLATGAILAVEDEGGNIGRVSSSYGPRTRAWRGINCNDFNGIDREVNRSLERTLQATVTAGAIGFITGGPETALIGAMGQLLIGQLWTYGSWSISCL
jgi:hypothetical protein